MNFHLEGLEPAQLVLLQELGPWSKQYGFYLGGGTAISLYLGHRKSDDLDWFTSQSIADPLLLSGRLKSDHPHFVTTHTSLGTLYGTMHGVKISFFEYLYPLLQPVVEWPETGCNLASLDDLACMKLAAIAQRGSRKDFYDIYALVSEYKPLADLLQLYCQKYGFHNISPVLLGLAYFDDAEEEPDVRRLTGPGWTQVRKSITKWVREICSTT